MSRHLSIVEGTYSGDFREGGVSRWITLDRPLDHLVQGQRVKLVVISMQEHESQKQ